MSRGLAKSVVVTLFGLLSTSLLLKADVPSVPSGVWQPAGDFISPPTGAASVALADGRLLVSGGMPRDGGPVDTIAVYDPNSGWTAAGNMTEARSGHAMALLPDGRVFISGGMTASGISASFEIYSPETRTSA